MMEYSEEERQERLNQNLERISAWTQQIREAPADLVAGFYLRRAEVYDDLGRYDLAIADCDEALRLVHDAGEFYNERAYYYARMGIYEYAIRDMDEAIRLDPYPSHYARRGSYFYRQQDYTRALADLTQAVQCLHPHGYMYLRRGMVYQDGFQDYASALADYDKALSISKPEWHYGLYGKAKDLAQERRQQVLDLLNTPPAE